MWEKIQQPTGCIFNFNYFSIVSLCRRCTCKGCNYIQCLELHLGYVKKCIWRRYPSPPGPSHVMHTNDSSKTMPEWHSKDWRFFPTERERHLYAKVARGSEDKRPLNHIHDPLEAAHAIHTAVRGFGKGQYSLPNMIRDSCTCLL